MFLINFIKRTALIFFITFSTLSANNSIQVEMLKSKQQTNNGTVTLVLTNSSNHQIKVLTWNSPLEKTLHSNLFAVKYNKKAIKYTGKLVKRTPPKESDYTTFEAHEKRIVSIKLPNYYTMDKKGNYSIEFRGMFQIKKGLKKKKTLTKSKTTQAITINYTPIKNKIKKQSKVTANFNGCSSSKKSTLNGAQNEAISIAKDSFNVMSDAPSNTSSERYATWFGSPSSSRQATVTSHFKNIYNALDNETINFDCSTCKSESDIDYDATYAYVYPDESYTVYLCGVFWTVNQAGTDSQAGTLVHELSHFNILAGTDDHVYGKTDAKDLARTNPTKATDNAENHEYFAENTPSLTMDTRDGSSSSSGENDSFKNARTISSFPLSDTIDTPKEKKYYKFIAKKSAEYLISTSGNDDPNGSLYDSKYTLLAYNDDINTDEKNYNFYFYNHLIKNRTYYLMVAAYENETAKYTLKSSYVSRQKNDFNGDTISDILWRNGKYLSLWYMKTNGKHTYKYIGSKSTSYKIEGIYDFNYDGIADILWRNGKKLSLWYMNKNGTHTYKYIGSKSTSYKIKALADFDDNGIIDILWQNGTKLSLWYMKSNGTHVYKYIGSKSSSYKVEKVADMNNDNMADILWRKGTKLSIWYMNKNGTHVYKYIGSKSTSYKITGLADFNADGIADIFWKKGGGNYLWYMNSDGTHRYKNIGSKSGYNVNNIVDMNGDGIADILWRRGSTNALWYMKSTGKHSYKNIGSKSTSYIPY